MAILFFKKGERAMAMTEKEKTLIPEILAIAMTLQEKDLERIMWFMDGVRCGSGGANGNREKK